MASPRFLFLLMSCSCPLCLRKYESTTDNNITVCSFIPKKYFGTFYFESHSIFVMKKYKYIYVYNQINK